MAVLYIAEFAKPAGGVNATVAPLPPIAEQTVAIGGSSTASSAFNAQTTLIRVHTDAICSISIGAAATSSKMRLAAGQTEYFVVTPSQILNVITNT